MGSIPLPALSVQTPQPQQSNPLQQYAQLMQLRQQQQNAPLQQQALQQQVQNGALEGQQKQLQLQNAQQGEQDQQALRALASDPSNKGKTVGELADIAFHDGKIAPQTYSSLKKADIEQRTSLASLDEKQLAVADASHKQLQGVYDSVMDMTPEQVQQNWPSIAEAANSVHGNTQFHLDPAQPMTKEQLQSAGPMLAMQRTYIDEANERKAKQSTAAKAQADADKSNAEVSFYQNPSAHPGGAPGVPVETVQQADWLSKHPGKGPADFAVSQAAAKAGAEESARMPGEMALARQRQALSQGDPNSAAKLLVSGDATLSELKARGATPEFIQNTLNAAHQLSGGKYNAQAADAQFQVAKSAENTKFFGSANSLTDKGGTLDQLAAAGKAIPGNQVPAFNSIADWEKAATGSGPLAKYAATALGVADDYSKVMGGGSGSDTSRLQALNLIKSNASPEARSAAIQGIRGAVSSQTKSRIGNNDVMKRMYSSAADTVKMKAPNGQTQDVPADQVDHYKQQGATVVQ